MKKIAIIGAAGYTAGELIRLLIHHPKVEIITLVSQSQTGKKVSEVHTDLLGETDLAFAEKLTEQPDLIFICSGHGKTKPFLEANQISDETTIIDMSSDFRLMSPENPFVYALPEWNRESTKTANRIANCGCFATAMQLAILPLAKAGWLKNDLHINGITGSTGAGVKPIPTTHFSWRNNNVSIYKAFNHQHLNEVNQLLQNFQPNYTGEVNFLPMRGNFSRGILATVYTKIDQSFEEVFKLFQNFYKNEPFTHVTDQDVHLKQVVNTNKCILKVEKHGEKVLITSMIDNLLKGASGQAVQNMNIRFGWEEGTGLHLKAAAF